jgi:hypothetical protein
VGVDSENQAEFVRLYVRANEAANALHTQAKEVYEMGKRLEQLAKDTTIRYATLRVRVEARAAFEQAMDLREAFEQMGKEMRGES